MWLLLGFLFLRSRTASIFHPFTFYLAFHGLVFVVRPILVYAFNLEHVFYVIQFYPTDEQMEFALLLTTTALMVFAAANWFLDSSIPRADRENPSGFTTLEWRAFMIVAAVLGPVAIYSAYYNSLSQTVGLLGDPLIELDIDPATGIPTHVNTNGYFADAQVSLGALSLMLIWGANFRPWSFLPLIGFLLDRVYIGTARWTILMTAATLLLLFLVRQKRRWIPVHLIVLALPIMVVFQQLGENRTIFRSMILGVGSIDDQDDILEAGRSWMERHDSPDFANFDFLTYVIDVVPEKTGTYSYFTQYLQLFTEPIPRTLWPDKPVGAPIKLVNLYDFGNFGGTWTVSIVGDGWISLGWPGVIVTMIIVGFLGARMHRWFWRGEASHFKILTYCTFVPLTVQWYRDGGISITKFLLFMVGPLTLWHWLLKLMQWAIGFSGRHERLAEVNLHKLSAQHGGSRPARPT